MMKTIFIPLGDIYVPVKHHGKLDGAKAESLAEDILENGMHTPIQVRLGKDRYVLVTGLHRLEAARLLGEETVESLVVQARRN